MRRSAAIPVQECGDQTPRLVCAIGVDNGLNASARDFIRIGMGLHRCVVAKSEAIQHGFGWGDPAVIEATTDLVMKYNVTPDTPRPAVDSWFSNKLGGTIKLTPAQWTTVEASTSEFKAYLS